MKKQGVFSVNEHNIRQVRENGGCLTPYRVNSDRSGNVTFLGHRYMPASADVANIMNKGL